MADEHFRISVDTRSNDVVVVTLDRPECRNAMSAQMLAGLIAWLDTAQAQSAGAIVLHGNGSGLCAGSDIIMLAGMSGNERSAFERDSGILARSIARHPVPIVAAVHGFAIGGGLTLAAACDIVISRADARWSLPEVPIGLFPAWGLECVAARMGRPAARRLALGIDVLTGDEAKVFGLVDEISDDPFAVAIALGHRLSALPRAQVAAVKCYFAPDQSWNHGDELANELFIEATGTVAAQATFVKFSGKGE